MLVAPLFFAALALLLWPMVAQKKRQKIATTKNDNDNEKENDDNEFIAKPLLTDNELEFYGRLLDALPRDAIFVQVAMGALMAPKAAQHTDHFWRMRSKFAQKFVDFVICEPSTLAVIAIIELDDRTHDPVKDIARDAMLASAGYTVLRWQSNRKPDATEIASAVSACR